MKASHTNQHVLLTVSIRVYSSLFQGCRHPNSNAGVSSLFGWLAKLAKSLIVRHFITVTAASADEDDELFNSWLAKASISNALASWSGRIVAAATRNVDDNACRRFRRE